MDLDLIDSVPGGLTRRARDFVAVHGIRVDTRSVEERRQRWLDRGIPAHAVDRMASFQERWGGLLLPPAAQYDGGPKYLSARSPGGSASEGWWFDAGPRRTAVPYAFRIGPTGEFGIHADHWAPLHATVEGWIEALALSHHAAACAERITRLTGDDVNRLDLDAMEPVREVRGLSDTWWRSTDSLVALCTGEARCLSFPRGRTAWIYSGLDQWGLYGVGDEMT
ncbi:hypothetical protein H9Y04_27740 [Streptomyces sp. TRM66268-LWL]|uniref:SMI1/KNR4 family protein n=1 Tax=Streptomyces polyasparticus TaxID=2767826 RepID=A0ABR7SNA6_9ACTN|nr:hypothetical protein [Streptomyces polyasparticus]MBC9716334.1 hypothetical protein [Streptomyces polyasparticus]